MSSRSPGPSVPNSAGGRRLTVQGWQNLVLSVMGAVVLAGAVAGAVLLNRTDYVSRELIDDIQPARVAAYQLQAALRDQETAVRGYAHRRRPAVPGAVLRRAAHRIDRGRGHPASWWATAATSSTT